MLSFISQVANSEIAAAGYGPPLYDAKNVATSVIYWPETNNKGELEEESFRIAETDSTPKPSAKLEELPKYLPNGGTILSVHQPATALSWLEENYDTPFVRLIHNSNVFSGPLSMMLFPDTPALALFGPVNGEESGKLAQELANKSNFPVITRPSAYDPISLFKSLVPFIDLHGIETGDTHGRETSTTDNRTASQPSGGPRSENILGSDRGGDGVGGEGSGQDEINRDPIQPVG
ncbi:hypothetical protein B0H11DRAFT_1314155 [Mycena galericulata]|nr:hypothetical protein B0H11DRAFT_1314075 [Mycena galericulata]KAJ7509311.1 hypothetical protein B0H11DRAFT_1314155 [Mycena galericulata]